MKTKLSYDPNTGVFTRLVSAGNTKVGDEVGSYTGKGYLRVYINGKRILLHRLAWFFVYGVWPSGQIDHIDEDKSNNRITNLRDVDNRRNKLNTSKPNSTNKLGVIGVHKLPSGRYRASLCGVGLGTYDSIEEASKIYEEEKCKTINNL